MHTVRVFEIWLQRNCSFVHCARMAAIVKLVDGLLLSGKATLAELAHWLSGNVKRLWIIVDWSDVELGPGSRRWHRWAGIG